MSASRARRLALGAQGFGVPRPTGRVDRRHVRRMLGARRPDPDRLGERHRALPGAAALRAPRSAPARPAHGNGRGRRALRVLGSRGVAASDRAVPAHALAHGCRRRQSRRVERPHPPRPRAPGLRRGGLRGGARARPHVGVRARRPRREVGAVVGLAARQAGARVPVLVRPALRPAPHELRADVRPDRAPDPTRVVRRAGSERGRRAQGAPRARGATRSASGRRGTSPTTTGSTSRSRVRCWPSWSRRGG